jgi:hypothetical protein
MNIRFWKTLKQYSLDEISVSYWPKDKLDLGWDDDSESETSTSDQEPINTPSNNIKQFNTLPNPYPLRAQPESSQSSTAQVELNNTPWWLPPLNRPSAQHLQEFNNFSENYLCNCVWWKVTNPTTYY